jgi:hypothetical protein
MATMTKMLNQPVIQQVRLRFRVTFVLYLTPLVTAMARSSPMMVILRVDALKAMYEMQAEIQLHDDRIW